MKILFLALALLTATPAAAEVQLHVDRSDLELTVYHDGRELDKYPLAMGKPTDPTPLGTWQIRAIDVNPDWAGLKVGGYIPSGPRSPMGRIRLRYNHPFALHGTPKPETIGTYASLGCIRMKNGDIIDLAKLILLDTNSWQGEDWYQTMLAEPYKMFHIPLKEPVTITIVE
jgi:lipoprotein-anchoring transpeptidase ErfK/SrfK